ncbi:unnamed protein product [Malus baccata var. baccata]
MKNLENSSETTPPIPTYSERFGLSINIYLQGEQIAYVPSLRDQVTHILAHVGKDYEPLKYLMPCAILARVGKDFKPLEQFMLCAVSARAGEDFKPLEQLMPSAVSARAGEDFEPLERNVALCNLGFDTA